MRKDSRLYLESLRKRDLSQDMNCLNSLQATPWAVNTKVLEVMKECWFSGQQWAGLPPRDDLPLPAYPFDKLPEELDEFEKIGFKEWKKERSQLHAFNNRSMSKRIQMERMLQMADRYTTYDQFYYCWQMDFRGRKYPVESFMTPQSADYGKALLKFSEGTLMDNYEDAKWLAIHGANVYGNDKLPLRERIEFAYDTTTINMAQRIAKDPLGSLEWTEADEPWQFLAWCFEWAEWTQKGKGFYTHIPCAADGSCNGLQWLSALMRDERGGRSVNLIPNDKPQDIYREVAEATQQRLQRLWDEEAHGMARSLLDFGINRSTCKRSVMIVPYSGTLFSCRDYILEHIQERFRAGEHTPWGEDHWSAATFLAKEVWDSIADVIVSASQVMEYVKYIGSEYGKAQIPMEWVTPTNFLVRQAYPDVRQKRIKTHLNGSITKLNINEPIANTINKSKTRSGASPNFIHSLDAAHLTRVVNRGSRDGIKNWAMIHDSFGCPSPQAGLLNQITREEFVSIHEEHDPLEELRVYAERKLGKSLERPPAKGQLDVREVLKSDYFFA